MLQEITVDDIKNINRSMSKDNLLLIYNELKEHQEELGINKYYFDDNFYWVSYRLTISSEDIKKMDNGGVIYGKTPIMPHYDKRNKDKWYFFWKKVQQKYGKVSWCNSHNFFNYLHILMNKMRPDEEYSKILLEEKKIEDEKRREALAIKRSQEVIEEEPIIFKPEPKFKSKAIIKKQSDNNKYKGYIYGIRIDNELAYIGKTIRPIKERIAEHIECIMNENINNSQQNYLYKAMRLCQGYKFEILFQQEEIDNHSLEMIEKTLIENIKPKFNYEGVKVPYRFSEEK